MKKLVLLASMALVAVAFAVPASASAAHHFIHNKEGGHKQIEGTPQVTFEGRAGFGNIFGGYTCDIEADVTIHTNDASIGTFDIPNTAGCVGTGILENCELTVHEATNDGSPLSHENPWTVDINPETTDLIITGVEIYNAYTVEPEVCEVPELELTFEEVTAVPDNVTEISSLTLSGQGVTHIFGAEPATEVLENAKFDVVGEDAGTYGITNLP